MSRYSLAVKMIALALLVALVAPLADARGRVLASATARIEVEKVGLEGRVVAAAQRWSFVYGLGAIALSLAMGWMAGRLFARG
jgi:hypothetical protein